MNGKEFARQIMDDFARISKETEKEWRACLVSVIITGGWRDSERTALWNKIIRNNLTALDTFRTTR